MPVQDLLGLSRFYAEIGLSGVLATQMHAAPWAPLAVAGCASPDLQLASGVAVATARAPFETAMSAIELDVMTDGRFTLGLGSGTGDWCRELYGVEVDRPVARLAETVDAIRAVVSGLYARKRVLFDGDFVRFDLAGTEPTVLPRRRQIPIAIGGLGAPMARLAGRVGDGLIGHPLWTQRWIDGVIAPAYDAGLAAGVRQPADCWRMHWVFVAASVDRRQALEDAKRTVGFYAAMPAYEYFFRWHGYASEAGNARALRSSGATEEIHKVIPDEMATDFVIVGGPDEVSDLLGMRFTVEALCPVPPVAVPGRRQAHYAAAITGMIPSLCGR